MDNNSDELSTVFRALSDPTRRAVVQQLTRGPATVSELAEPFEMALPSFLKHIGVLEAAGLVRSGKVGRVRTCRIEPAMLSAAEQWIGDQTSLWEGRMARLARHVEARADEPRED